MNVGTVTYHDSNNFGAVLQAYALQKTLQKMGHQCRIVNYKNREITGSLWIKPERGPRQFALNSMVLLHYRKLRKRRLKFREFSYEYMNLTEKEYRSINELESDVSLFDAFICGSDQIWNPNITFDPVYYLNFVKSPHTKRIAYAPSFGINSIPTAYREEVKDLLYNIQYLSVREERGAEIIRELAGREPPVVLDPTLLMKRNEWDEIAVNPGIDKPYILVYPLQKSYLLNETAGVIKEKTGLPVATISGMGPNAVKCSDISIRDAGPREFLGLFKNACFICTNSFHGTAFSIIYEKPFYTVPHSKVNSRITNLLDMLELSGRQITDVSDISPVPTDIDYVKARQHLNDRINSSLEFIEKSLGVEDGERYDA